MGKMGGTRQPREMAKKDKFLWISSQEAYISHSVSTVLCPGSNPWDCNDIIRPSRLSNLEYISTGEQFKMFQKLESASNQLRAVISLNIICLYIIKLQSEEKNNVENIYVNLSHTSDFSRLNTEITASLNNSGDWLANKFASRG